MRNPFIFPDLNTEVGTAQGQRYEKQALSHLSKHGLKEVARNYRSRFGEIDLIMQDCDGTLVFVEVKARKHERQVPILESITPAQLHRIRTTASQFLQQKAWRHCACRFDVVTITGSEAQLQWYRNVDTV